MDSGPSQHGRLVAGGGPASVASIGELAVAASALGVASSFTSMGKTLGYVSSFLGHTFQHPKAQESRAPENSSRARVRRPRAPDDHGGAATFPWGLEPARAECLHPSVSSGPSRCFQALRAISQDFLTFFIVFVKLP